MNGIIDSMTKPAARAALIFSRLRFFVARYGLMEIMGTITATLAGLAAHQLTGSLLVTAIAGSLGETVGFYGTAAYREIRQYYQLHHEHARLRRIWLTSLHAVRGMLIEFGPAEVVDSLFVRPALMYILPQVTGNIATGLLAGKLLADVVFYGIAAIGHSMRTRMHPTP